MPDDLQLVQRLLKVRLVALDVDGVLSDRCFLTDGEREWKRFDVQDGHGIVVAQRAGIAFAIISGRDSVATAARAKELGITEVFQGVREKKAVLKQIAERLELTAENVLYMGDDIQDLSAMAWSGCSAAPADANSEVTQRASVVTRAVGGRGAVREVLELILKSQGSWRPIVDAYLR